jgi:hypothetical protein
MSAGFLRRGLVHILPARTEGSISTREGKKERGGMIAIAMITRKK